MKYTLDATNKKLGRLASEIAVLLMGKNRPDFAKNRIPDVSVEILNSSKIVVTANKLRDKTYVSHSGYPGALKTSTMSQIVEKKGMKEVLKRAVLGMLPKNKLRPQMMKNLDIKD
ncbi:MAG: 50S ribosomal protein L13 [bacterium]|nr:50S ribosomal protein L13 [bacterium]